MLISKGLVKLFKLEEQIYQETSSRKATAQFGYQDKSRAIKTDKDSDDKFFDINEVRKPKRGKL